MPPPPAAPAAQAPAAQAPATEYVLRVATSDADHDSFARLAEQYHRYLAEQHGVELHFQDIEAEIATLPGCYSHPGGFILLARAAQQSQLQQHQQRMGEHAPQQHQQQQQQQHLMVEEEDVGIVAVRPLRSHGTDAAEAAAAIAPSAGGGTTTTTTTTTTQAEGDTAFDPASACELKRLWVAPGHQQAGLGRQLLQAALARARQAGYRLVLLDTLKALGAANRLYAAAGFVQRPPYYHNPLEDVIFWQLDLMTA